MDPPYYYSTLDAFWVGTHTTSPNICYLHYHLPSVSVTLWFVFFSGLCCAICQSTKRSISMSGRTDFHLQYIIPQHFPRQEYISLVHEKIYALKKNRFPNFISFHFDQSLRRTRILWAQSYYLSFSSVWITNIWQTIWVIWGKWISLYSVTNWILRRQFLEGGKNNKKVPFLNGFLDYVVRDDKGNFLIPVICQIFDMNQITIKFKTDRDMTHFFFVTVSIAKCQWDKQNQRYHNSKIGAQKLSALKMNFFSFCMTLAPSYHLRLLDQCQALFWSLPSSCFSCLTHEH